MPKPNGSSKRKPTKVQRVFGAGFRMGIEKSGTEIDRLKRALEVKRNQLRAFLG